MNAVITADIVNYSNLSKNDADNVLSAIHNLFENHNWVKTNLTIRHSITRGDKIQLEISKAEKSLVVALMLKTAIKKVPMKNANRHGSGVDVRMAIGIGSINAKRKSVDESSGDAYTFSGRTLDTMKRNKRMLTIKTSNSDVDAEIETAFKLLEVIMSDWKLTSTEAIFYTLIGYNERQIAAELEISQSAVNQRKKTAGWSGIDPLIKRFEHLIKNKTL